MNKDELLAQIIKLNILPKHYSIGEEIKDDAYNIEKLYDGNYAYYYLEKGEKQGYQVFVTEEEALSKLLESLELNLKHGVDLTK